MLAVPAACGQAKGGEGAHEQAHSDDEHQHGAGEGQAEEQAEEKTDAHHLAEGRLECEEDVTLPPGAVERYGIQVGPVREATLAPTLSAPGHLVFPQGAVAHVGSAVAGRIVELHVRSGDTVSSGDPLLTLESPELGEAQSEYLQRRTIAASAGPALEISRSGFERAKQLYESSQGVAFSEVQRREAELRQAESEREVARAAEAAAHNRLLLLGLSAARIGALEETGRIEPRLAIQAPIGGRVVEIAATLGELVDPSKDRLIVIGDLSRLWAIAEVSESRLAEVALGAHARVQVPALQHAGREGRVAAVPTTIEASTRTAEVRIELPNPDGTLLPGMFIQVEITSSRGAGTKALVVPDGAVLSVEGRSSVFVPIEPGGSAFCKHEVEIGTPVGDLIPVLAGLSAGDPVVVSGAFRLKAELGKASAQHEH
jgi:cobalt-zinc-cadmium efflux system membrane fusion protein